MLAGSTLPNIIAQFLGYETGFLLPFLQAAALIVFAVIVDQWPRWRPLMGFIIAVAVLRLNWSVLSPAISSSYVVGEINQTMSFGGRLFVSRLILALGMPLMLATMAGCSFPDRSLFLRRGDFCAPAAPEPFLWFRQPIAWSRLGLQLLVLFGVALPVYLFFSLPIHWQQWSRIGPLLPWALATAALNAASEEFQFRCVPLAQLRGVLPVRETLWLTAVFFGLGHYFGQPSGIPGVIMATIAGWLWAKSIVETRGVGWAFVIHFVQDVVIFCFLVLSQPV